MTLKPPNGIFSLPIFHNAYQFLLLVSQDIARFPKKDRYTFGGRIYSVTLDIVVLLFRANAVRVDRRILTLREVSISLDLLKILIRAAKDIRAIPEKRYIVLQEKLQEIGQMLGGW